MSANGAMAGSTRLAPKFDVDAPIESTGVDIPAGNYPGVIRKFGDCIYMKSSFKDGEQLRMPIHFAVRVKNGALASLSGLVSPPSKGANGLEVHIRSNLFKLIAAACPGAITKEGKLAKGFKLSDVFGKPLVVEVAENKNKFPAFKSVMRSVDGLKYPTADEVSAMAAVEEEELAALAAQAEGVPF